jgi:hypothetical protein
LFDKNVPRFFFFTLAAMDTEKELADGDELFDRLDAIEVRLEEMERRHMKIETLLERLLNGFEKMVNNQQMIAESFEKMVNQQQIFTEAVEALHLLQNGKTGSSSANYGSMNFTVPKPTVKHQFGYKDPDEFTQEQFWHTLKPSNMPFPPSTATPAKPPPFPSGSTITTSGFYQLPSTFAESIHSSFSPSSTAGFSSSSCTPPRSSPPTPF